MGFFSWVGSAVDSVSSFASSAWNKAKEVAGSTLDWMADKAEGFVGKVKEVWTKVKPFIEKVVRPGVKIAAEWSAKNLPTFPWVSGALTAFDKALGVLLAWDQSEMAKKVDAAIRWAIQKARDLRDTWLSEAEMAEAEEHEENLRKARDDVRGDAAKALDLARLITSYAQLATRIKDVLENNAIADFQHYLRLRAAQKLLKDTEQRLVEAMDIQSITADDLFLTEVAAELLKPQPQLSGEQTERLDSIVLQRFGKKLIPFVFEELIMAWGVNLKALEAEWKQLSDGVSEQKMQLRRLEVGQRLAELTAEEAVQLAALQVELPKLAAQMEHKRKRTNEMRNYVFAAEGFLQMLEKTEEDFAGEEYLIEDSATVGMLIIDCAQGENTWEDLSEEQRCLIVDFANIFEEASRARAERLVEVAA
ncbi:hypothetical protein [Pseudomonas aeruginosa]|uniref:hypothetical protein n=1 Tax=Pseudomonas aeruginosa TaxID=287 RepID=UPI003F51BAE3